MIRAMALHPYFNLPRSSSRTKVCADKYNPLNLSICDTGKSCPLHKAMRLREAYHAAVFNYDDKKKLHGERLEMALFVREVANGAAENKDIGKSEVWSNMLGPNKSGNAGSSYERSYLKQDIDRMENDIKRAKQKMEDAAEKLTDYIASSRFQNHMLKFHRDVPLQSTVIKRIYDCQPKSNQGVYRELDHYLACLTENLAASDKGHSFLERLLKEQELGKMVAFKDMWDYMGKVQGATEPMGKFLYNVAPVLTMEASRLLTKGAAKSFRDVLKNRKIAAILDFLNKKTKVDFAELVEKRAKGFSKLSRKISLQINRHNGAKNVLKTLDEEFKDDVAVKKAKAFDKLDGQWFGLMLGIVSLSMSTIDLLSDFKKKGFKDFVGVINDVAGLAKSVAEGVELSKTASGYMEKAATMNKVVRGLGILGCILGAILSAIAIYEGWKSGDWDKILLGVGGFVASGISMVGIIASSATCTGIGAVVGLLLAIIASLVLDPKIIDYLEDTAWGEDSEDGDVIKVKDTKDEFYKAMYSVDVDFELDKHDSEDSHIAITCNLLGDRVPVYVTIKDEDNKNKSLGRKAVYPGKKTVRGKGLVKKDELSFKYTNFYGIGKRKIRIFKPWEIWNVKRDNDTDYTILAQLDPDRDGKMELSDSTTGVEFPKKQTPLLVKPNAFNDVRYITSPKISVYNFEGNLAYPSDGKVHLSVKTRHAKGARLKVRAEKTTGWNKDMSTRIQTVTEEYTKLWVSIERPDKGDDYDMTFHFSLHKDDKSDAYDSYNYDCRVYRA